MAQANTLAQPLSLTEDEIDDLLYLARANETQDLPAYLAELSQTRPGSSHADVLVSAVDAASGNSALHYAAANGHTGTCLLIDPIARKPHPHHQSTLSKKKKNPSGYK